MEPLRGHYIIIFFNYKMFPLSCHLCQNYKKILHLVHYVINFVIFLKQAQYEDAISYMINDDTINICMSNML